MMEEFMAQERRFEQFPSNYRSSLNNFLSGAKQTKTIFQCQLTSIENILAARRLLIQNELISQVSRNSLFIKELSQRIDCLDCVFDQYNDQFDNIAHEHPLEPKQKKNVVSEEVDKNGNDTKKGRIHYKTIFRQKIFGVKSYKYKLDLEGKPPQIFFKERNICLNISLLAKDGQKAINQNAISLNLKVYYSNGEEVGPTKKGANFIKGTVNSIMINGKASFDKLYPRQVTRKLDKRKIILTIYASAIGNSGCEEGNRVDPEEIEPIIIYGIKVITKQTKDFWPKPKQCPNLMNPQKDGQIHKNNGKMGQLIFIEVDLIKN